MKKKVIISALALTIGAGLAGSITSTAAWYQYSTRTNAAYIGASGGATGNLNMRIRKDGLAADEGWTTFLAKETLENYVQSQGYGTNIQPVTPGALDKDSALTSDASGLKMYSNPVPGRAAYESWNRASVKNYIVIPLQLRYVSQGNSGPENTAVAVYLSDLVLQQRVTDTETNDISEALRFHISSYSSADSSQKENRLISKKGGTTMTKGKLDLDGDGNPDTARPSASDKYGFSSDYSSLTEIEYGAGKQFAYTAEQFDEYGVSGRTYYNEEDVLTTESANVYSLIAKSREGKNGDDLIDANLAYDAANGTSKSIGSTVAGSTNFLNVDITIWVEGWQKFSNDSGYSSIWSKKFIGSEFNIGFEFAVNAEDDNA